MNFERAILALGTVLVAVGIQWLLPGSGTKSRVLGGVLALVGFGCLAARLPVVGDWLAGGLFYGMSAVTVIAAVATISFRKPVYCAIWFGMALAGTAGLFLLAGAEFLAVATVVVYAGAILVTFLFVLMLAEPEGHSPCDQHSWEAVISALTGAVLVGVLTSMILAPIESSSLKTPADVQPAGAVVDSVRHAPSISQLGAVLFTQYLVATEAAGALLFAALVGAAVIVSQGRAAMRRPALSKSGAKWFPRERGGPSHAS
jgi:NADH-quinone oxidoreductase subunit J